MIQAQSYLFLLRQVHNMFYSGLTLLLEWCWMCMLAYHLRMHLDVLACIIEANQG